MVELIDYSDKFGKRIGMKYPYNPELNNALKSKIGFPGMTIVTGKHCKRS